MQAFGEPDAIEATVGDANEFFDGTSDIDVAHFADRQGVLSGLVAYAAAVCPSDAVDIATQVERSYPNVGLREGNAVRPSGSPVTADDADAMLEVADDVEPR